MSTGFLQSAGVWIEATDGQPQLRPLRALQQAPGDGAWLNPPPDVVPVPDIIDTGRRLQQLPPRTPPTWITGPEVEAVALALDLPSAQLLVFTQQPGPQLAARQPRRSDYGFEVIALSPMDFGPNTWDLQILAPQRPRTPPTRAVEIHPLMVLLDAAQFVLFADAPRVQRPPPRAPQTQMLDGLREWTIDLVASQLIWMQPPVMPRRQPTALLSPAALSPANVAQPVAPDPATQYVWVDAMPTVQQRLPARSAYFQAQLEPPSWFAVVSIPMQGPYYCVAMQVSWLGAVAGELEAE